VGISYPGFYSTYSLLSNHPLKAVSPQACSDFFFDDFHHNGAYLLSLLESDSLFGIQNRTHNKKLGIKCQIWGLKTITNFFDAGTFV
jgi:predicted acyl esterase